jgi:glutamate N-acetyltransferase/amino-acid N-acetyltransferase
MNIEPIPNGSVTSPKGFLAGGIAAAIKSRPGALDLGILFSDRDCAAAGVFTTNLVRSGPVSVSEARAKKGLLRGVVVNSGNANAPFNEQGIRDAEEMARLAAQRMGVDADLMAVSSTGVTGVALPLDKVRSGLPRLELSPDGGHRFAEATMTTDTYAKSYAIAVKDGNSTLYTVGGCCKGSGMIHPNMATMLAYVTTDANVDPDYLQELVRDIADETFNMVTVDGDTSCSDTFMVFANGAAGGEPIREDSPEALDLREALGSVAGRLAKLLARDGEGASHLIEVHVTGGPSVGETRLLAKTVALSSLVKTAVAGNDPNWGRILVAAGRSGAPIDPVRTTLTLQGEVLFDQGRVIPFEEAVLHEKMKADEVRIGLDLRLGEHEATAWGCDLTTDYVHINADYRT